MLGFGEPSTFFDSQLSIICRFRGNLATFLTPLCHAAIFLLSDSFFFSEMNPISYAQKGVVFRSQNVVLRETEICGKQVKTSGSQSCTWVKQHFVYLNSLDLLFLISCSFCVGRTPGPRSCNQELWIYPGVKVVGCSPNLFSCSSKVIIQLQACVWPLGWGLYFKSQSCVQVLANEM